MNQQTAKKLILKTRDDYNLIADQFASTRKFNWGDFAHVLDTITFKKGFKVLDLGCGNGRVYELLKDRGIEYFGLDLSKDLIQHAKKNVPTGHFVVGDMLNTNYNDNEFDVVISVATIHHIPSRAMREAAFREIYRVLKPGGTAIVTTWYFWDKTKYLKLIFREAYLRLLGRSKLDFGDFMMTWKEGSGKLITDRYFHAWKKSELRHTLRKTGFTEISLTHYIKHIKGAGRNIIAICKKPL